MNTDLVTNIPTVSQENVDQLAQTLCFYATGNWGEEIVFLSGKDLHPQRLGPNPSFKGPLWKSYQHKAMCQIVAFIELTETMNGLRR